MVLSTVMAVLVAAAPVPAPAEYRVVDATEVHALLVSGKAVVVDVRSAQEYAEAHIPGAVAIPADRIMAQAAALPRDRGTPIVFYCRGAG